MNDAQREYIVQKIDKNKKTIKTLSICAASNAFCLGVMAPITLMVSLKMASQYYYGIVDIETIKTLASVGVSGVSSAGFLNLLIRNLAKKAGLEAMTEKLRYDLDMDGLENKDLNNDSLESGGRTR